MKKQLFFPVLCLGLIAGAVSVDAQSFGNTAKNSQVAVSPANPIPALNPAPTRVSPPTANLPSANKPVAGQTTATPTPQPVSGAAGDVPEGQFFMPDHVFDLPTQDGSKRGGVAITQVNEKGVPLRTSKIFLYYDNFQISRSINGITSCDVRFYINNNLDRRITSLDVKLVWPQLTTTLSFADIAPNQPNYYNYTLMGDGCYSMDKMPNIVVNRCRVRGMTAAECAGKITWLQSAGAR